MLYWKKVVDLNPVMEEGMGRAKHDPCPRTQHLEGSGSDISNWDHPVMFHTILG